jgi:CheY-like chemotaxis protein
MPGMSGVEVYERVLAVAPPLARRFVFLTGGTISTDIREWLERTRVPLVEKPADPARVVDAVLRQEAAEAQAVTA